MNFYAEINENNICKAVLSTPYNMVDNIFMIQIPIYDISFLGKKWNGMEWEEVPPEVI